MKRKRAPKREKVHLIFDEKERRDYLTGFRKRKLARKLKAKQDLDNLLKEEKRKIKQSQKEAFHKALLTQRQVPEVQHLLEPVTYDLPDHTVTISTIEDFGAVPVTSTLITSKDDTVIPNSIKDDEDEIEKMRKLIRDLKAKRIKTLKKSSVQFAAKNLQKKLDRQKAKKKKKLLERSLKHAKKKHKKKKNK